MGRGLIILGFSLVLIGIVISLAGKIPYLGKLPGDIYIKKENFSFYFPLTTSLLISVVLTIILWLINKK